MDDFDIALLRLLTIGTALMLIGFLLFVAPGQSLLQQL
jgi:hypothetical protein